MFNCQTIEEARRKRDEIIEDYGDIAEKAMSCLDDGFECAMTAMVLPWHLRPHFRTSNQIERVNRELKRRSTVIGAFPNEASLLRLMGSVLIELNDIVRARKAVYSFDTFNAIKNSEVSHKLVLIAKEQAALRAA